MKIDKVVILALVVCGFLIAAVSPTVALDEQEEIIDGQNDVYFLDYFGILTENYVTEIVTSHDDINVENIDIKKATYTRTDETVTVTLEVVNEIENRGSFTDINYDIVNYDFTIETTTDSYYITYMNNTCQYASSQDIELINVSESNFSVDRGVLSVTFELNSAEEEYVLMYSNSTFLKIDAEKLMEIEEIEDLEDIDPEELKEIVVYLTDAVPNPDVQVVIYSTNVGIVDKEIQFNASVSWGVPDFVYEWDFDDGSTSSERNPTHSFEKKGNYTVSVTVTDSIDGTVTDSLDIKISGEDDEEGSPILIFVAVIAIIIVIGTLIVVVIVRR